MTNHALSALRAASLDLGAARSHLLVAADLLDGDDGPFDRAIRAHQAAELAGAVRWMVLRITTVVAADLKYRQRRGDK